MHSESKIRFLAIKIYRNLLVKIILKNFFSSSLSESVLLQLEYKCICRIILRDILYILFVATL